MSKESEDRLAEWASWYVYNKDRVPPEDLKKRVDFLTLALDGALECIAHFAKDIQIIEQRKRSSIMLPNAVKIDDLPGIRLRG